MNLPSNIQMNDNTRLAIKIAGAGLAVFVGFKIFRAIKERMAASAIEDANKRLKTTDITPATLNDAEAVQLANQLYSAMAGVGTDEDVIETVMFRKIKNGNDLLKVQTAFGAKRYGVYGAPMDSWYWTSSSENLELMGWFRKELSGSLMGRIESLYEQYGINI